MPASSQYYRNGREASVLKDRIGTGWEGEQRLYGNHVKTQNDCSGASSPGLSSKMAVNWVCCCCFLNVKNCISILDRQCPGLPGRQLSARRRRLCHNCILLTLEHSLSVGHAAVLETGPLPLQNHKSGTVCCPISDYVGCHTASSGVTEDIFIRTVRPRHSVNCF